MSFYNMLFGMNSHADLLLAVVGLRKVDVERLRDVSFDGEAIEVYTRTGGGNRDGYPNLAMRKRPEWAGSVDDDFDSTYCTDRLIVPSEWREDVANLRDPLTHGMRAEFAQHLAVTMRRQPTESDQTQALHDAERAALARTAHIMANGHTFVPLDDAALKVAIELAEKNGGKLLTCWGIAPIALDIKRNVKPWPNATREADRHYLIRARIDYDFRWTMDADYWQHMQMVFGDSHPLTIANIAQTVAQHTKAEVAA